MKKLTEEKQLQIVEDYKSGLSAQQIADNLECSQTTVLNYLKKYNVKTRSKAGIHQVKFDPEEIIELYNSGFSAYEIQKYVGCKSVNTIYNFIRKHCEIRNGRHGKPWNQNLKKDFFKEPLSERAQYWLGFLFADGSIYNTKENRNPTISLEISTKDRYLIEQFKSDLGLDNKIQEITKEDGRQEVRIQFACKEISDDLAKFGILPNKTYHIKNFIGDEKTLTGHMLRGFLDGDGWITIATDNISATVGFIGNYYTMEILRWILFVKLDVQMDVPIIMNAEKNRWPKLQYRRYKDIIKLFEFMYPEDTTLYLQRKKDKFIKLFNNRKQKNLETPLPSLWETIE